MVDGLVILRANVSGVEMLYPIESNLRNMPRIGERLDIGDVFGPCATVLMVTHYASSGLHYPGEVMRRNGIKSCWGVNARFQTVIDVELDDDFYTPHCFETWHGQMRRIVIDVELDDDFYTPHCFETWHGQMGWDNAEWLKN